MDELDALIDEEDELDALIDEKSPEVPPGPGASSAVGDTVYSSLERYGKQLGDPVAMLKRALGPAGGLVTAGETAHKVASGESPFPLYESLKGMARGGAEKVARHVAESGAREGVPAALGEMWTPEVQKSLLTAPSEADRSMKETAISGVRGGELDKTSIDALSAILGVPGVSGALGGVAKSIPASAARPAEALLRPNLPIQAAHAQSRIASSAPTVWSEGPFQNLPSAPVVTRYARQGAKTVGGRSRPAAPVPAPAQPARPPAPADPLMRHQLDLRDYGEMPHRSIPRSAADRLDELARYRRELPAAERLARETAKGKRQAKKDLGEVKDPMESMGVEMAELKASGVKAKKAHPTYKAYKKTKKAHQAAKDQYELMKPDLSASERAWPKAMLKQSKDIKGRAHTKMKKESGVREKWSRAGEINQGEPMWSGKADLKAAQHRLGRAGRKADDAAGALRDIRDLGPTSKMGRAADFVMDIPIVGVPARAAPHLAEATAGVLRYMADAHPAQAAKLAAAVGPKAAGPLLPEAIAAEVEAAHEELMRTDPEYRIAALEE